MLRLILLAAAACVAYRFVRENIPRIPRDFDLPGGSPPAPARRTGQSAPTGLATGHEAGHTTGHEDGCETVRQTGARAGDHTRRRRR